MARVELKTTCPLDCWDACGMVATIENGRLVKLGGDPDHPVTRGYLCGKTMRYGERVYAPDRILHPLRRTGGCGFERISWDAALDLAAEKITGALNAGGPHAVLHLQEGGNMGVMKRLSTRFFNLLGGKTEFVGDICFGAGEAAMIECCGEQASHTPQDLTNSKLILFWGRNPFITHIHWIPFLKEAKAAGARLVSINPLRIDKSGLFDEQIQPRPGSDLFLAAFLAKYLLDQGALDHGWLAAHATGIEAFTKELSGVSLEKTAVATGLSTATLTTLAASYAASKPAAIYLGAGLQHHANGRETVGLLCALGALTGNLGKAGGGVSFFSKHRKPFDLERFTPRPEVRNREVALAKFASAIPALRDPAPALIWVNGANPVRTLPDSDGVARAFAAIPFKIVADFIPNDTTALADLILPTTSFLEEGGVVSSYGHGFLGRMNAVLPAQGEARSDGWIWKQLATRLGFGGQMPADEGEWLAEMTPGLTDAGRAELSECGFTANPGVPDVSFAGGRFATPDGKFHFPSSSGLEAAWPAPSPELPLQLLSPKNPRTLNSQAPVALQSRPPEVALHPDTAARLNLAAGAAVTVRSAQAGVPAVLALDSAVHPQAARFHAAGSTLHKTGINRLTGPATDTTGLCPAYYTTFVEITPR